MASTVALEVSLLISRGPLRLPTDDALEPSSKTVAEHILVSLTHYGYVSCFYLCLLRKGPQIATEDNNGLINDSLNNVAEAHRGSSSIYSLAQVWCL